MNDQSQLLLRSIKGPVIMITIGVLFAADKFTAYPFRQTFPILLIVIGLLQLVGGRRRKADYYPPPAPAASAQPYPPPAVTLQQTPPQHEAPRSEDGRDENQEHRS
jgi:hypothetical protein